MDYRKTVEERLNEMGVDIPSVTKLEWDYLIKIQQVVESEEERLSQALNMLQNISINVAKMTSILGISRNTPYRYPLISAYITDAQNHLEHRKPFVQIKDLKSESAAQQDKINKMITRDVLIEIEKGRVQELEKTIANLTARNQEYQQELQKAATIIFAYEKKERMRKTEKSVVSFPPKN